MGLLLAETELTELLAQHDKQCTLKSPQNTDKYNVMCTNECHIHESSRNGTF